jgi:flagellar basal body-associated protein FliL
MRSKNLYAWTIILAILVVFFVAYIISLSFKVNKEAPVSQIEVKQEVEPVQSQPGLSISPSLPVRTNSFGKSSITINYPPKQAEAVSSPVEEDQIAKKSEELQDSFLQPTASSDNGDESTSSGQKKSGKNVSAEQVNQMSKKGIVLF